MNQTLTMPILGLENEFPDQVWLLKHPASGKYACYCHNGVMGLACFSDEAGAVRFGEFIDLAGMATQQVVFDDAREVAKARPMPVISLMLLDDLAEPKIHYIR